MNSIFWKAKRGTGADKTQDGRDCGWRRYCRISYREGLGTSPCVMGLTTQDSHNQKEHTELYKILKFRVNWANIEQDTAIQKLYLSGNPYISLQILKFLNGCILFNIGPINTKHKDFVKLSVLFLNIWVLCC